jgi:hypothetical protein
MHRQHRVYKMLLSCIETLIVSTPKVVVNWLALMLHIWDIPGSNLGTATVCRGLRFS